MNIHVAPKGLEFVRRRFSGLSYQLDKAEKALEAAELVRGEAWEALDARYPGAVPLGALAKHDEAISELLRRVNTLRELLRLPLRV